MSERTISGCMRQDFLSLAPAMPIREAVTRMVEAHASAAPVVDESGRLVGILSQKDCFGPALKASYYQQWKGTVAEQMTTAIETLSAETEMVSAAEVFLSRPFRTYPVMRDGVLVGVLDRQDLLAAFLGGG